MRVDPIIKSIILEIENLEKEINYIFKELVIPTWENSEYHDLINTLYGLIMRVMSYIDFLSYLYDSTPTKKKPRGHQTKRMIDFMNKYFDEHVEQNTILVHVWRHKLMHAKEPQILLNKKNDIEYAWLVHWGEPYLPKDQHYKFNTNLKGTKIFQFGLTFLTNQLLLAAQKFEQDLNSNESLQANFLNNWVKNIETNQKTLIEI